MMINLDLHPGDILSVANFQTFMPGSPSSLHQFDWAVRQLLTLFYGGVKGHFFLILHTILQCIKCDDLFFRKKYDPSLKPSIPRKSG
jgi:hypothetical protein